MTVQMTGVTSDDWSCHACHWLGQSLGFHFTVNEQRSHRIPLTRLDPNATRTNRGTPSRGVESAPPVGSGGGELSTYHQSGLPNAKTSLRCTIPPSTCTDFYSSHTPSNKLRRAEPSKLFFFGFRTQWRLNPPQSRTRRIGLRLQRPSCSNYRTLEKLITARSWDIRGHNVDCRSGHTQGVSLSPEN